MTNIKEITLLTNKEIETLFNVPVRAQRDNNPNSIIVFNFPVKFCCLSIEELKELLRKWIKAEEIRYPQEKGFKGRWLLFEEIKKVFEEK